MDKALSRSVDLFSNNALGITLHFPEINGLFNNGLLAGIGGLLSYFFAILVLIFVGFSIYAGFKIATSQGDSKEIETGITLIKNVWISVAWGIVFFIALSVIGTFMGVGNVTQWYYQLAQCHDSTGGFYFRDIAAQEQEGIVGTSMYCCKVINPTALPDIYQEVRFKKDTYHFIAIDSAANPIMAPTGVPVGNPPGIPSGLDECVYVK